MHNDFYDIVIIGAGPAGMAAAIAAAEKAPQAVIALIEREAAAGGILKQCIHDGFGLIRFKERLTGPEYAWRYQEMLKQYPNIRVFISTFVSNIEKTAELQEKAAQQRNKTALQEALCSAAVPAGTGSQNRKQQPEHTFHHALPEYTFCADGARFIIECINPEYGVFYLRSAALISATGCRERTDRQILIHGDRPSGIFTAGQAQAFINIKGCLPGKRFVILGSGDIGLIMARRLTLESAVYGGSVEGVYEVKPEPSGLTRNLVQCLNDYGIPLHLSTTVSRLHGTGRLEGVTVVQVDETFTPIADTERYIPCDTLILSVGLIPENDILEPLAPAMDPRTKGPCVNQYMETDIKGLFCCGNALHVNDLVDYVSDSGEIAGARAASGDTGGTSYSGLPVTADSTLLYQIPSRVVQDGGTAVFYFRSARTCENKRFVIRAGTAADAPVIFEKKYRFLKPPELETFKLSTALIPAGAEALHCTLEDIP